MCLIKGHVGHVGGIVCLINGHVGSIVCLIKGHVGGLTRWEVWCV